MPWWWISCDGSYLCFWKGSYVRQLLAFQERLLARFQLLVFQSMSRDRVAFCCFHGLYRRILFKYNLAARRCWEGARRGRQGEEPRRLVCRPSAYRQGPCAARVVHHRDAGSRAALACRYRGRWLHGARCGPGHASVTDARVGRGRGGGARRC